MITQFELIEGENSYPQFIENSAIVTDKGIGSLF